jgi:hypothetical protein
MPSIEVVMIRSEAASLKPSVLDEHDRSCFVCGFDFAPVLVMHHITPVAEGGDNGRDNLVIVCPTCHAMVHQLMRTYRVIADGFGPFDDESLGREYLDWWGSVETDGRWSGDHDERIWLVVHRGVGRCS